MMVSPGIEQGAQLLDGFLGDFAGWQHDPYCARSLQKSGHESLEIGCASHALSGDGMDGGRVLVKHDAVMAVSGETPDDIAAHTSEANHAKLHCGLLPKCHHLKASSMADLSVAKPFNDLGAEMETQHPAPALGQHFEIAPGFRRLDDAEGVFLAGNREIVGVVAGDLQEDAAVGPALVGLPGGMQKARAEPKAGRDALAVAHKPRISCSALYASSLRSM